MYWYNPTTRTSERVAAPVDDAEAISMLAGHPDSARFVGEYAELRRSGAPIERALVLVGHEERLREHEHAPLRLAWRERSRRKRPTALAYELLLAARLREQGEERRPTTGPTSGTPRKNVAVVDRDGAIVAVNGAWRAFARENGGDPAKVSEGVNYLAVCDGAGGDQSGYAAAFAEGLRAVLSGREATFEVEYPCHSPTERRWYVGSARPLESNGSPLAVVTHENSTGSTPLSC
jgi:PAS domain-containing protein